MEIKHLTLATRLVVEVALEVEDTEEKLDLVQRQELQTLVVAVAVVVQVVIMVQLGVAEL